jgi:flagellar hook-length control protein FliK
MIIQNKENTTQSSLSDLLGGNSKNSTSTEPNDLFSKLLASMGKQSKGDTDKIVKSNDFKTIIDPKNIPTNNSKDISLQVSKNISSSLLKEVQSLLGGESTLISNELLSNFSADQMKNLIHRAKEYLKNEISAKSPDYQVDSKSLPKTLAGLVKLAEKLELAPQSITLSTLISDSEEKAQLSPELLSKPLLDIKALAALPTVIQEESPMEAITQLLSEIKAKEQKNTKSTSSTEISEQEFPEKVETQPLKALLQNIDKHDAGSTATGTTELVDPVKAASTSSMNHTKAESLISLLQGSSEEKDSKTEASNSLKVEGESLKALHAPKAESLEVKSKEAQQSMRLFASDLKEAVQEYKPPFTRITMKLNPEKLGEVEVTLVQRGNNVHVNIQSNNTNSVAFLAHNATELKAQLASQGITNATMNFMSGGENQQQNQQQHQQQQQNRFRAYESFEELELNEEQISALEIIIPHYA